MNNKKSQAFRKWCRQNGEISTLLKKKQTRKRRACVSIVLALIVAFMTVGNLAFPAITMSLTDIVPGSGYGSQMEDDGSTEEVSPDADGNEEADGSVLILNEDSVNEGFSETDGEEGFDESAEVTDPDPEAAGETDDFGVEALPLEKTMKLMASSGADSLLGAAGAGGNTSVTGTIIPYQNVIADGEYIIFTQSGNKYYALTNNGTKVAVSYNPTTGRVTYTGGESVVWKTQYVGSSGWPDHYLFNALKNSEYYLDPGSGTYNNLFRQWYGRVTLKKGNNANSYTVNGDNGGKYLGWVNSSFGATDSANCSIYLAKVEALQMQYTLTFKVDDPSHGFVYGTNDSGTATGNVAGFTVSTSAVNAQGIGYYDAKSRPITAQAADGYIFDHWEVNGAWLWGNSVIDRMMTVPGDNMVLTAVFKKDTTVTDDMTKEEIKDQLAAWAEDMLADTVTTNKTAQVTDYDNRIYEITLSASSGVRRVMPTVDLEFITDVSRSMFFPATLTEVATFTQGTKNETSPGIHYAANGDVVYADSSLFDWLYKYGDKNTVYYTIADNSAATVVAIYYDTNVINPADTSRTGVWRYQDSSAVNPPDGVNNPGKALPTTGKAEPWNNNLTGKLYTQVGTLTRMDYLKMAAEAASEVIFGVDPTARIGLVTFADKVYGSNFYSNDSAFVSALSAVTLTGGTNQGAGLDSGKTLFSNNNRSNPVPKRVAILITDGAPNQTGVNWTTIGTSATNLKNLYGKDSVELFTLGLSMSMVGEDNRNGLKNIATGGADGGHWAMAEDGSDIVEAVKGIIGSIVSEASLKGNITDTIDEAFYPVTADGTPLAAGDYISLDGEKLDKNLLPSDGKYGKITFDGKNFGVEWSNQLVAYDASNAPTWSGNIYIKAKEDFLGGNSINTNAGTGDKFVPTKYVIDGSEYNLRTGDAGKLTKTFETPYVNVDELSMTQNSTEWTVYLGTNVNPQEQLTGLLNNIRIREVVSSSKNYMITDKKYMLGSSLTDASETFPLNQVLGKEGLSSEEWKLLISQGYLNVEYGAYGHENAGTLALSISKVGSGAEYTAHNANETGEDVEQYIISAVYIPAAAKDVEYHTTPGGSPGALTDNMRSDNMHVINVFAKKLGLFKTDQEKLTITGDTAEFVLYRKATAAEKKDASVVKVSPEGLPAGDYVIAQTLTTTDGFVMTDELLLTEDGEPYYLVETKAPDGYIRMSEPLKVVIDMDGHNTWTKVSDGSSSQTKPSPYVLSNWHQEAAVKLLKMDNTNFDPTITPVYSSENDTVSASVNYKIVNDAGYELPSTGGTGTGLFCLSGIILTGVTAAGLVKRKRRKEA